MNDSDEDDLLPDHVEIDTYLRATHSTLTDRLAAKLRLDDGLEAILHDDSSATEQDRVSGLTAQVSAARLISLRLRARASARTLENARGDVSHLINTWHDFVVAGYHLAPDSNERDHVLELRSERVHALRMMLPELATVAADLRQTFADLERARYLDEATEYARTLEHADYHTRSLARAISINRGRDGTLLLSVTSALDASMSIATRQINGLSTTLNLIPVDASSADLSQIDVEEFSALRGVMWTDQTIWPSGIARRVRPNSVQIREGLFEVRPGRGGKTPETRPPRPSDPDPHDRSHTDPPAALSSTRQAPPPRPPGSS